MYVKHRTRLPVMKISTPNCLTICQDVNLVRLYNFKSLWENDNIFIMNKFSFSQSVSFCSDKYNIVYLDLIFFTKVAFEIADQGKVTIQLMFQNTFQCFVLCVCAFF